MSKVIKTELFSTEEVYNNESIMGNLPLIEISTAFSAYGNQPTQTSLEPISESSFQKPCELKHGIYRGLIETKPVRYQVLKGNPCVLRTLFEENVVDIVDFGCNDTTEIGFYLLKSPLANFREEFNEEQINTLDDLLEKSHQMACQKIKGDK